MYKVSVPIMIETLENYGMENYISLLKEIGADRVFLCPASSKQMWSNYEREISRIRKYIPVFKEKGYEVGVWLWTFMFDKPSDFTYMVSPDGKESNSCVCPTDRNYRDLMGRFIEDAGKSGIDLIMFDDDYRYGFIDIGLGCCCNNHIKMINEITGENVDCNFLKDRLLFGEPNKYRDAYLKANGKALEDFAREMRRHLDNVNPECRMGFCACITSWDYDGTTPDKIATILAGKTKPFYRLIGAPYWANERNWGNRLADVIEMERLESALRDDDNIEIFSECDAFPRPRYKVPAAYTEGFDTALRAAGCTDGILKYIIDYTSHPLTEKGYIRSHIKNKNLYKEISAIFDGKTSCGIKVWYKPDNFRDMTVKEKDRGDIGKLINYDFPHPSRMLSACSIPTVYSGDAPCGIAFGEDIKIVPKKNLSGLIIDICAAEILKNKGIDVGIEAFGDVIKTSREVFKDSNNFSLLWSLETRECILNKKAEIESKFTVDDKEYPASFRYENKEGQRFLVLCFDGYCAQEDLYRQYGRQKLLTDSYKWLCGEELPLKSNGHPDLYIQTKTKNNTMAIGLWNFSPDEIEAPVLTVTSKCRINKTINCKAETENNIIKLSRIEPFGNAFMEIELI